MQPPCARKIRFPPYLYLCVTMSDSGVYDTCIPGSWGMGVWSVCYMLIM